MKNKLNWTTTTTDGVVHIGSDDFDTDKACDIIGVPAEVTCPQCLQGVIEMTTAELMEARHYLAELNPEGWACLPNCHLCN